MNLKGQILFIKVLIRTRLSIRIIRKIKKRIKVNKNQEKKIMKKNILITILLILGMAAAISAQSMKKDASPCTEIKGKTYVIFVTGKFDKTDSPPHARSGRSSANRPH